MIGTLIKILLMLAVLLLLAYPILPLPLKLRKFSTSYALSYQSPHNKKNIFFTLIATFITVVAAIFLGLFNQLVDILYGIPFVGSLFQQAINGLNSQVDFIAITIKMIIVNLVILYAFVIIKAFVKGLILDPIFGVKKEGTDKEKGKKSGGWWIFGKKKKKDSGSAEEPAKKTPKEIEAEREEERKRKRMRVPTFAHSSESEEEEPKKDTPAENEGENEEESKPFLS